MLEWQGSSQVTEKTVLAFFEWSIIKRAEHDVLEETINNYQTNTMYSETMETKTSLPKSLSPWTILVHWEPKMTLTGISHSGSHRRWSSRFGNNPYVVESGDETNSFNVTVGQQRLFH